MGGPRGPVVAARPAPARPAALRGVARWGSARGGAGGTGGPAGLRPGRVPKSRAAP